MTLTEAYWRPTYADLMNVPMYIKVAVLFSAFAEHIKFGETVFYDRGWNMRVFDDYKAAVEWLLSKQFVPPDPNRRNKTGTDR